MILVNGVVAESVSAIDRGLSYGDGVFRSLVAWQGRPRHWRSHYGKLEHDCAALAIPCPPAGVLEKEIALAAEDTPEAVGRIIVTRGSGERGYAPPATPSPTRIVMVSAMPEYPPEFARDGVVVRVCETRYASQPRLAGVKHLNRLENVLARAEWNDRGTAEGLMLDADGQVIGGTMTNLFIVENGALVTPGLSRCGVSGVTRKRILHAAQRAGVACSEEAVPLSRLLRAQEAMLVNSVVGAWFIKSCAGTRWTVGTLYERVREWIDDEGD